MTKIKIDKCDGYEEIDVDGWYMVYEDTPGYTMAYFECKEHAEMFANHINKTIERHEFMHRLFNPAVSSTNDEHSYDTSQMTEDEFDDVVDNATHAALDVMTAVTGPVTFEEMCELNDFIAAMMRRHVTVEEVT